MNLLKGLLAHHWRRRKARNILVAMGPDLAAAYTLLVMNRWARHNRDHRGRDLTYAMKTRLVAHFYKMGWVESYRLVKQNLSCYGCNGSGRSYFAQDDDDYCERCAGSGIWQTHVLYEFAVRVAGDPFCWHQPAAFVDDYLADHRSASIEEMALFEDREPAAEPHRTLSQDDIEVNLLVLAYYLSDRGYEVPKLDGFKAVIREWWRFEVVGPLKRWLGRPRKATVLRYVGDEDDIPF